MAKKKSYKQRNQESIEKYGKSLYQRRIESAQAKGASRSQARGHPRKGENPLSFIDQMVKTLQDFFLGRERPNETVEELPSSPPQEPIRPPSGGTLRPPSIIEYETPTVEREADNVFYVGSTKMTYGRWQAGTDEAVAEREDIEDLLDTIPQNYQWYILIIWGKTVGIYPDKAEQNVYLSLLTHRDIMFQAFQSNPNGTVTDWINNMEQYKQGTPLAWEEVYTVSVADSFKRG